MTTQKIQSGSEKLLKIIEPCQMTDAERRENNIASTPVKCVFYDSQGVPISEVKKDVRYSFVKGRKGAHYGILYNLKGEPIDRANYLHV